MSPNVSSFVGDLVEMAKAFEELPQVQEELSKVNTMNASQAEAIQRLEMRIMELKAESEAKSSTIHSLEVARDDAELRFLEADEKAHKARYLLDGVLDTLKGAQTDVIRSADMIDPPKAEEPKPESQQQPVEAKPEPTSINEMGSSYYPTPEPLYRQPQVALSGEPAIVDSWASAPTPPYAEPGQSATLPIATLPIDESPAPIQPVQEESAGSQPPPNAPYLNKLYYDHPTWVGREEWISGGGDDRSYDWRPGVTHR
jgi:hypothetical protein